MSTLGTVLQHDPGFDMSPPELLHWPLSSDNLSLVYAIFWNALSDQHYMDHVTLQQLTRSQIACLHLAGQFGICNTSIVHGMYLVPMVIL